MIVHVQPEGHLLTVGNAGSATYSYDAFGRRVREVSGSGTFEYLFDLFGHRVTNRDTSAIWLAGTWIAGRHWGTANGTSLAFLHTDWLGITRVLTDLSGNPIQYRQNHHRVSENKKPLTATGMDEGGVGPIASPAKPEFLLTSLPGGINGKPKGTGVHCSGAEGRENESGQPTEAR